MMPPSVLGRTGLAVVIRECCVLRRPLPPWEFKDYLGWMEQGDGRLAYGVFVQNGRLKGELKTALRRVIERYELPVIITANQNIILTEIHPSWKADILDSLAGAGVRYRLSPLLSSRTFLLNSCPSYCKACSLRRLNSCKRCEGSAHW